MTTFQFAAVWFIVVARSFVFTDLSGNEMDVLPIAYQLTNPDWLPGDWYLNLEAAYRVLFNTFAGPLVAAVGFKGAAIVGRLVALTLFSSAVFIFLRTFRIRLGFGLLFLVFFLNNQTLIAGEWMTGGFEAKALAWPFVLLTIVSVVGGRWRSAFAAAGAALSFHVLVGLYAVFCAACAVCLNRRTHMPTWKHLQHSWLFLLTGALGLSAVVQHLLGSSGSSDGWLTYVMFRVPHHVLPSFWNGSLWIIEFLAITVALGAIYWRTSSPRLRFLAAYGLGSVGLFSIGLAIAALGPVELLRFYWFRFPDSILPFIALMLAAYAVSRGLDRLDRNGRGSKVRVAEAGLAVVLVVASAVEIAAGLPGLKPGVAWGHSDGAPMYDWVSRHTAPESSFLVDPSESMFYVRAERSLFVAFKHSPQSAHDVAEWFDRLTLLNGGDTLTGSSFTAAEQTAFDRLEAAQLTFLRDEFGIDYYIGNSERPLPFAVLHKEGGLVLYDLN